MIFEVFDLDGRFLAIVLEFLLKVSDLVLQLADVTQVSIAQLELVLLDVVQGILLVVLLLHKEFHHAVDFTELLVEVVQQSFAVGS